MRIGLLEDDRDQAEMLREKARVFLRAMLEDAA